MNPCKLYAFLVLLAFTFLRPVGAAAQDVASVVVDKATYNGWNMTITNGNTPGQLPINHVGLKLLTPGVQFVGASDPTNWLDDISNSFDSIGWRASGQSINYRQSLNGFEFYIDGFTYGQPVQIEWTTLNNSSVVTRGQFSLIPTEFQSLARYDSVVTKTSLLGPDPCFTYKIYAFNSGSFAIKSASFQLLGPGGTMRPSEIQVPNGWLIDSLTPSTAFFHSTGNGNDIESGKNLDGFRVCLRANPSVSNYTFVWTMRTDNGALIDRDTIRNLNITPGSNGFTSADTVLANRLTGCLYAFTVQNYHATNPTPPSAIDKIVFTSTTPGVTFQSAPTAPQNWGKAINGASNGLTFQSQAADALQSGNVSNFFQANLNNPAGGAFTLHWETSYGGTAISNGDLHLSCTESVNGKDTATLASSSNCCYKLSVVNQHNPPSNVYAISLSIPKNQGQFQTTAGSVASSLSWGVSQPDNQSIRYTAPTGSFQGSSVSQDLNFCTIPVSNSTAVPITWTTYDQAGATISTGVTNASCTLSVAGKCDSVLLAPISQQDCRYGLIIGNRRGTGSPVKTVTVSPLDGWKINFDSVAAGWTGVADPNGSSVRFSSPTGISDGVQFGFMLGFVGYNTANNFHVVVSSTDENSNVCLDTIALTCQSTQAGVNQDMASQLSLTVAPNPFSAQSDVNFDLPARSNVSLTLVDILGRTHQVLLNSALDAGQHSVKIDGGSLPPGPYYLRFETLFARLTKKLVITR